MDYNNTLNLLRDWKKLPAYRAEPRIDFIVAGALPEIIKDKYGCNIRLLIPEFPIRIGTIEENGHSNLSKKVDFYVYLENGEHIFIEFKSDSHSRRIKQDKYLLDAQRIGMIALLNGIINISLKTRFRIKYSYLIEKLINAELISLNDNNHKVIVTADKIKILYIQPKAKRDNEISFTKISQIMKDSNDLFYEKFSEMLLSWSDD